MSGVDFKCQMVNYDGEDQWFPIVAYDAEYAAEEYAEQCHSRSGGDLFRDHSTAETIRVRDADGQEYRFQVHAEYSLDFHADEIDG